MRGGRGCGGGGHTDTCTHERERGESKRGGEKERKGEREEWEGFTDQGMMADTIVGVDFMFRSCQQNFLTMVNVPLSFSKEQLVVFLVVRVYVLVAPEGKGEGKERMVGRSVMGMSNPRLTSKTLFSFFKRKKCCSCLAPLPSRQWSLKRVFHTPPFKGERMHDEEKNVRKHMFSPL